jgi:hypothetical protein
MSLPGDRPIDERAVREFFADVHVGIEQAQRQEASGWVVLSTDLESGKHVHVVGPFQTPEQALAYAGDRDRDPQAGLVVDGQPGWSHTVVAMFPEHELQSNEGGKR